MTIKEYIYDAETDTLRIVFEGADDDSFTKRIGVDVYLLKRMVAESLNGVIVKNASIDTGKKQKVIDDENITGIDIAEMIGKKNVRR